MQTTLSISKKEPACTLVRRAPGLAAREVSDGQIHPDSLRLGEIVERGGAVLAAEAGVPLAAPGQAHVGIAIGVHPDRAGAGPLGEALQLADVAAPDAGSEAVGRAVGDAQGVGLVLELDDADDGAKNLLLRDPHLVLDIGEHGRADEIAALADTRSACDECRAFPLADVDIVEDRLHLLLGDDGTERGLAIEGIADPKRLPTRRDPLDD